MSLILSTPTNPGPAVWGDGSAVTGAPTPFIYQPGGNPAPNTYQNWYELVEAYNAWGAKTDLPDFAGLKQAIIYFDASYTATSIANPALGAPTLILRPETTLAPTKPYSDGDETTWTPVNLGTLVQWQLAPDSNNQISFIAKGLKFVGLNKAVSLLVKKTGTTPTSARMRMLSSGVDINSAVVGVRFFELPGTALDIWIDCGFAKLQKNPSSNDRLIKIPAGATFNLTAEGLSTIEDFFESSGPVNPLIQLDVPVRAAAQQALQLAAATEFFGPSASDNVRPSPAITVLCRDQLALFGANNIPQVKQAFLFGLQAQPTANDTLSITDGSNTETFTFVAAAVNPFEVTIGLTVDLTLANLAAAIDSDSVLWEGAFIANPQTGSQGVAILRASQTQESYPDRAYGTFASGTPFLGTYNDTNGEGTQLLSYAQPTLNLLPSLDPGVGIAGFATVAPLVDGTVVTVLDARSDGLFQALNPLGLADSGSWKLVAAPSDAPLFLNSAGASTRQTRLILADATVASFAIALPTNQAIPGALLAIRRTDAAAGNSVTLIPTSGNINGAANLVIAVALPGAVLTCDGTDWWTVGHST
jgi:hypothetical protein